MTRIFRLIALLTTALAAGLLLVLSVLYLRGDFSGIAVKETLTFPIDVENIQIEQGESNYVFDKIEYHEYDLAAGKERLKSVTPAQYKDIAKMLNQSQSLSRDRYLMHKFEEANPATLTLFVRPENSEATWRSHAYQSIQFLENSDYFRIQRPEKEGPYIWDYYRHPLAHSKVQKIILEPVQKL